MVKDANASSLDCFFDPDNVADYLADGIVQGGANPIRITGMLSAGQFRRAQEMYTRTLSAMLMNGRNILNQSDNEMHISYADILCHDRVKQLAPFYLNDVEVDPWGNPYLLFPGPWPKNNDPLASAKEPNGNLNIFRIFMPSLYSGMPLLPGQRPSYAKPDALTINFAPDTPPEQVAEVQDPDTLEYEVYGYSAPRDMKVFIYSLGKNMVSGQAIYSNSVYSWKSYDGEDRLTWGGGDDINNWDWDQSWMRFYN